MRVLSSLLLMAATLAAQPDPNKIKVLIFSGWNNHEWRQTTPYLKGILLDSGRFDVRVQEWPAGATARTLEPFDTIVLDYCGPRWGEAAEAAVENFVRSGKGLVVVHAASYPFGTAPVLGDHMTSTGRTEPPWMEYRKMVGAWWQREEGKKPYTGHGDRHSFQVKFTDRSHPIAQGLGESFWATDELYEQFIMMPGVKVLATAFDDTRYKGTGKDEPILWTVEYGRGRVFHTALGHNVAAMQEPGFVATFLRGAQWAASGKVTLGAKLEPPQRGPRLLVVTGGHEYETSFYTLFEGMNWEHATTNEMAFHDDIRPKYDVLLLYDLHQSITDQARKNLRDFVEGGKGIVVLHHAVADYNDWQWWYRDVVGGRYLLKPGDGMPASTYKHDQEMFVTPAMRHPVVGDVGPMHLIDEAYGGVWVSKGVKVLLASDHPDVRGPVAWISPYDKSRVAVILLGHDHVAHENAAFRQLVKNAIAWSAGKN